MRYLEVTGILREYGLDWHTLGPDGYHIYKTTDKGNVFKNIAKNSMLIPNPKDEEELKYWIAMYLMTH